MTLNRDGGMKEVAIISSHSVLFLMLVCWQKTHSSHLLCHITRLGDIYHLKIKE